MCTIVELSSLPPNCSWLRSSRRCDMPFPKSKVCLIVAVCLGWSVSVLPAWAQDAMSALGPVGEVSLVKDGFQFTEGPAGNATGELFFTDIPADTIFRMTPQGEFVELVKPSGHANGLMLDASGKLLACQMDGSLVAIDPAKGAVKVLASEFEGKRFNAPNDLVIDKSGGVYFTDPLYRAPNPLPQGSMGVYYRDASGKVTQVAKDLPAPNGVGLSPDESTLYVIPSQSPDMLAYPITEPGKVGASRVLCKLKQPENLPESRPGGGDGMTVDELGNLYITAATGVQVFSAGGEYLGTIKVPQQPANVIFAGMEGKTLYMTARTGLYRVEMKVRGWQPKGTVPVPE